MEPLLNGQCASQSLGPANQLFGLLVQTILAAQCTISPPDMWPKDYGPTALAQGLDEYDFVIVGAGSAGSVVANRLSENPEWKVLLLEAGGDPPIESEIASMSGTLQHSAVDWAYHVQRSSRASLSLRNGTFWPRGRTLGGSGAINGMQYVRGNRRDYDRWKDLGNPEWSWEDVLEYFKKSENMNVPELVRGNGSRYHRTGGYLNIEQPVDDTELNQILRQAAVELKKEWVPDFNQERHIGYGSTQFTMIGATRCSPAKAFLSPIKHRFNLHVIKNAMVEKVLVDESNVATGVSFVLQNKIRMNAVANKEVIVAAGSINTPQLLMLSGIGQTEELEKFDIPTKANLNVGGNLQDHVAVPLFFKFPNLRQYGNNTFWKFNEIDALYEFTLKNRSRGIGNSRYLDTMVFLNTANASDRYPDAQVVNVIFPKGEGSIGQLIRNFEYIRPISDSLMEAEREASVLCSYIVALNIKSRGKIRLASADPRVHPLIDANYFGHEDDLQTLIRGIRIQQELLGTNAFRTNRGSLHRVNIPDCQQLEYDTDEYWECYVRHMTITSYHPVGTAKMGPSTDPEAVVDSRLRVKGIRGLRVIDASIMPVVVSGNTNAPTIMIGEMGSDFIKQEYA